MALTQAEQAELDMLNGATTGGLSPDEASELARLNAQAGVSNMVKPPVAPEPEKVLNEMPEGLSGRFTYKNFGANPEASFNFLQKENPGFEMKKDKDGEVLARKRGAKDWGRLDPKGFDWRDLTDVLYDVPAGIAQGTATAAGGVAGGIAAAPTLVGAPVGAIAGASAAGSSSGVALEGLRQGIGKMMGIDENFSGQDLGIAGASGAVSPLLFGTGAGAKEVGKYALKQGLSDSAEKALLASQRGVAGRGYDAVAGYVGPKVASVVSGENADVIKKAASMIPELKAADKNPEVRTLPLKAIVEQVPQRLKAETKKVGDRMGELKAMIDAPPMSGEPGLMLASEAGAKGSIPKSQFLEPFQVLAEKITKGGAATEAQLADAEALAKVMKSEFDGLPDNLTAAQVDTLRDRFRERAKQYGLNYGKSGSTVSATSGASAIDAQIASAFEGSRRKMGDALVERLEAMNKGAGQEFRDLSEQYSYLKDVATDNKQKFSSPKAVSNFLSRATKDDIEAQNLLEIQKITGLDLQDLAVRDQAISVFSNPNSALRSLGGSTSTSRTIPLALAGGAAGYYTGQQSGGDTSPYLMSVLGGVLGAKAGSPAALRQYMNINNAVRSAPQQMPGYKALPYLMMNPELHDQGEK